MISTLTPKSIFQIVAAAVFGRASTAASQVVAGIYLEPKEFGVYAAAVGMTSLTTLFRGGGTGNHLQTMTLAEFRASGGPFFRYATLFSMLGLAVTLLAAWFVSTRPATEMSAPPTQVAMTAAVSGLTFAIVTTAWYGRCRMLSCGRVQEIALLDCAQGAIKFTATFLLARIGLGALALALPLAISAIVEGLWLALRSGTTLRELEIAEPWLRRTARELVLPLVMALLWTLNNQTDSFVASFFVPVASLGLYFFASQLAMQPNAIVSTTLRSIFASAAARVRGDASRERQSLQYVFNGSMVFMPIVTMALPAVFPSCDRAIWSSKWADCRYPIFVLCATLMYPMALQLVAAPIAGLRNWKLAIFIDLGRALPKILGAALAGGFIVWFDTAPATSALVLALMIGLASGIASSVMLYRIMARTGLTPATIVFELYATPLAAMLSAIASADIAQSLTEPLVAKIGPKGAATIECAVASLLYGSLAIALLRFGYTRTLEQLISALPAPIQSRARSILQF